MSDDEKPKHFVIPPCYQIFDKAWFCVTPMNQVSQIYKTGEIEDCTSILTDWTLCIQAKAYYKEADKQRVMSKAQLYKSNQHINRIWKLKEKPGWLPEIESEAATDADGDFPSDFPKDLRQFPKGFSDDD